MAEFNIAPLQASPQIRAALSEILIEAVANGGSVSFMHPLAVDAADGGNSWHRQSEASGSFSAPSMANA
jgi:hypothetical protein